jgi:hypothetical protein
MYSRSPITVVGTPTRTSNIPKVVSNLLLGSLDRSRGTPRAEVRASSAAIEDM